MRNRVAIRYSIAGDLRFISHHDALRLFERAIARAGVPVRFSEGFNPRPRLSLTLPRSVGIASTDEMLVLDLSEPMDGEEIRSRMAAQMPQGLEIRGVERVDDQDRRLPFSADYELPVGAERNEALSQAAAAILERPEIFVERMTPGAKTQRRIDVRPYITAIRIEPGRVFWTQSITATGTIRPGEMLELLGLTPGDHLHRLQRTAVTYQR